MNSSEHLELGNAFVGSRQLMSAEYIHISTIISIDGNQTLDDNKRSFTDGNVVQTPVSELRHLKGLLRLQKFIT
jgi:hypothetical protein